MHHRIALDLLDSLLLLLLFGCCVVDQIQLISIVNGQLLAAGHSVGLENKVDDLIPAIGRGISKSMWANL
jgi:hypothetical protein